MVMAVLALAIQQVWQKNLLGRRPAPGPEMLDARALSDRLDVAIRQTLEDMGASPIFAIQAVENREEQGRRWTYRTVTVRVAAQIPLLRCNLAISKSVEAEGGHIISGQMAPSGNRLVLELGVDDLTTHHLEINSDKNIITTKGLLALIIDDFGAIDNQVAADIIQLPIPLAVAVIPGHPVSRQIAQQAVQGGHEVFVHLPMEPREGKVDEPNPILVTLTEDEIRRRVRWALDELPQATGVNNHMGSLATENEKIMRIVLGEIKAKDKYFVDSRTSAQSVAFDVARQIGLPCLKSSGFLDYVDQGAEIAKSLEALAQKALQDGSAVGIGHVKANTFRVLKTMIPQLEKQGLRFVPVSRLLDIGP
jgi:polysaccharide deacetylase 2 family uncharacterized protein YibQ